MSSVTTKPVSILLVEDDLGMRTAMHDGLVERGHAVTAVGSAEEALEHLRATRFGLLVTDYRLGGATGTWLARVAARSGQLDAPRVLLVTAYDDLPDAEGLPIVHKPFDYDVFLAKVEQVLAAPPSVRPLDVPLPAQRIAFTLYVNASPASERAMRTLRALVDAHRPDQIALTVVDVTRGFDDRAEEDRIVVTPTLVKTFPGPRTWIIGDLERKEIVDRILAQAGVERRSVA